MSNTQGIKLNSIEKIMVKSFFKAYIEIIETICSTKKNQ